MKAKKRYIIFPLLAAVLVLFLSSCSGDSGPTVITVGTTGDLFPYTYMGDDGILTGYDIESLRLLDEQMEDVTIEFVMVPFSVLFSQLEAGSFDMIANQIAKSPEREAKYLFSKEGYFYAQTQVVVQSDNETHTSLADFEGETLVALAGDYFAEFIDTYNAENGSPFSVQYYETYTPLFMDLSTGRITGTVNDVATVGHQAKELGLNIKCVGDVLEESFSYYCFMNDENGAETKEKIDAALGSALSNGTLTSLCVDWFGQDLTVPH